VKRVFAPNKLQGATRKTELLDKYAKLAQECRAASVKGELISKPEATQNSRGTRRLISFRTKRQLVISVFTVAFAIGQKADDKLSFCSEMIIKRRVATGTFESLRAFEINFTLNCEAALILGKFAYYPAIRFLRRAPCQFVRSKNPLHGGASPHSRPKLAVPSVVLIPVSCSNLPVPRGAPRCLCCSLYLLKNMGLCHTGSCHFVGLPHSVKEIELPLAA